MKRVLFIFEKVAHYHKQLFQRLEAELPELGFELHLLSGESANPGTGRVALREKVIRKEEKFVIHEWQVGSFTLRRAAGVMAHVRALRPDIVVCMGHVGNATHWRLALNKKALGYKLLAWQCGYEYNPGRLKAKLLANFVPRFDGHLAYHSNARDYAVQHGAPARAVTVIHNTINEAIISCIGKDEASRLVNERHPGIKGRAIILFVGAVLAEKRVEVLMDAMSLLQRQDAVLVVVGDGPHLPALRALAKGRDDVLLLGSIIDGVGPYFDAAEMYVLPGTGGLGINEAMAHSLPIISGYADGSADDLVRDGENGYRLRDGTAKELAGKLSLLLDQPAVAQRMGMTSRQWATGKFSFNEFIGRVKKGLCEA